MFAKSARQLTPAVPRRAVLQLPSAVRSQVCNKERQVDLVPTATNPVDYSAEEDRRNGTPSLPPCRAVRPTPLSLVRVRRFNGINYIPLLPRGFIASCRNIYILPCLFVGCQPVSAFSTGEPVRHITVRTRQSEWSTQRAGSDMPISGLQGQAGSRSGFRTVTSCEILVSSRCLSRMVRGAVLDRHAAARSRYCKKHRCEVQSEARDGDEGSA